MTSTLSWADANQQYVIGALAALRGRLEKREGGDTAAADELARAMSPEPALIKLSRSLQLSDFERDTLLLTAAVELDASFVEVIAEASGSARRTEATFGLALAALPNAHWSALAPAAPLRRWRLIETGPGSTLTSRPLHIDERVLHHLVGVDYIDPRLAGVIEDDGGHAEPLAPSQRAAVSQILAALRASAKDGVPAPAVHLRGSDPGAKRNVAGEVCAAIGMKLVVLPESAATFDEPLIVLLVRELRLSHAGLLVCWDQLDSPRARAIVRLLEHTDTPIFLAGYDGPRGTSRAVLSATVEKPSTEEQRSLWQATFSGASANVFEPVLAHFDLGTQSIRAAASAALTSVASGVASDLPSALWQSCRQLSRPRLDGLAQRIEPTATWGDLVVPAPLEEMLRLIAVHVSQRTSVHGEWAFTRQGGRGLGITALFSGESGTGKTLASEVLAGELGLDLYRVDLSQVVSKYIGETEKNLRALFEAAEDAAAVLLFDEADALFGKRSDVKDSHDRYANIEVSYLLQRMETYRGLAVLTTNLKSALDHAFLRRIQFVAQFPFPNADQRRAIWKRFFPPNANVEDLDFTALAKMNVAGGNIYNIARGATFRASDARSPVTMAHLLRAAQDEFAKLERPMGV